MVSSGQLPQGLGTKVNHSGGQSCLHDKPPVKALATKARWASLGGRTSHMRPHRAARGNDAVWTAASGGN